MPTPEGLPEELVLAAQLTHDLGDAFLNQRPPTQQTVDMAWRVLTLIAPRYGVDMDELLAKVRSRGGVQ
ncbi:MAG TPA: hypothetical protein VGK67_14025 [Myxococcales bacterium]|jgi:hypothetical protein